MNLMNLFNKNYLFQNLKKSRNILAIFIGLIPVLNTIILTMTLTTNETHIFNFTEISILNLIGIYFLPIVISICLFNYIYKKKSVDFINSMPISRKSIFITNTILGIIIFTLMLLINTILIWIVSLIFNSPIPFIMLIDYFLFYLVVYIFTFSATNLAMTISGNAITQIVVTLLLLFLIPFSHLYLKALYYENNNYNILLECTEETCKPDKYYCYDDINCTLNKELNRYSTYITPVVEKPNYTTPFNIFANVAFEENNLINSVSIIKMIILSIIYIILGYYLFLKRKMEVSETSFKNIHIHNLVKSLTLVPIATIAYIILRNQEIVFIIFVVLLMLIYYFIYDLITKKNIQNIKLSCLYFLITIISLTTIFSITNKEKDNNTILKYNDIKEISISINNTGREYNSKIYTSNKELINIVIKSLLTQEEHNEKTEYINTYLKTSNNKEYTTGVSITKENYDNIINILSKEKSYLNYYKNIDMNEIYAIKLGNKIYSNKEAKPYLNLIQTSLQKLTLKEYLELREKYNYINDNFYIKLYTYDKHDKQEISINSYINYDLLNAIVNSNNKHLNDIITPVIPNNYYLYYENAYLKDFYNIDFYVVRSAKNELYEFILKNTSDKVDMRKEFFTFTVQLNNNRYHFTTNKVEEIKSILDKKYDSIKNTDDYKNYYGLNTKEEVEYYD